MKGPFLLFRGGDGGSRHCKALFLVYAVGSVACILRRLAQEGFVVSIISIVFSNIIMVSALLARAWLRHGHVRVVGCWVG